LQVKLQGQGQSGTRLARLGKAAVKSLDKSNLVSDLPSDTGAGIGAEFKPQQTKEQQ
jgi:hypothetical protein